MFNTNLAELTYDSGWINIDLTNGYNSTGLNAVRKIGNEIYFSFFTSKLTVTLDVYEVAGTIPVGYRPTTKIPLAITVNGVAKCDGYISTDGKINIWSDTQTSAWRDAFIVYPAK